MANNVTFNEKELIGIIDDPKNPSSAWKIKVALMETISNKGNLEYYDIRNVKIDKDETICGKGITMNKEEFQKLGEIINQYFIDEDKK